jgi:folylpolyglutamate synthase/dihydropteroate synthase
MFESLQSSFEHVVITASKSDRSTSQEELATIAARFWGDNVTISGGVAKAIQDARELVTTKNLEAIVITGSLSVVGEALTFFQEENNED